MITHIKNVVAAAKKGNFAVGAFNTANLETTVGIIRAANKAKSPVIIQVSEATINYAGLKTIMSIIRNVVEMEGKKTLVAVHLDHGHSLSVIKDCIAVGFSSVHMDASEFDYKKNIRLTKAAAILAHKKGVWAQGELGSLYGKEGMTKVVKAANPNDYMTDPAKVEDFVYKTGIDSLAVSIGTMHGRFEGQEKIDYLRLDKIKTAVKEPLVLHGASGLNDQNLKKSVKGGIRIVNIDTDIRIAFTKTLKKTLAKENSFYDPRKILTPSIEAVEKTVYEKILTLKNKK